MNIGFDAKRALNNHTGLGVYSRNLLKPVQNGCAQWIKASSNNLDSALAEGNLLSHINTILGPDTESFIRSLVVHTHTNNSGTFATIAGIVVLLIGATGMFGELTDDLNDLWDVPVPARTKKPFFKNILAFLKKRLHLFIIFPVLSLAAVASLASGVLLSSLGTLVNSFFPASASLFELLSYAASIVITTVLFAMLYRFLPAVKLRWRSIVPGAFFTALLFLLGEFFIAYFLKQFANLPLFGPAGAVIAILIWIYYSSQIFFIGASFTYLYSKRHISGGKH